MKDYININKTAWNNKVGSHLKSDFYNLEGFKKGESSLKSIEQELLEDVSGKSILHLQCHFGQDTLSLARMGAQVTGVDLSDKAIDAAKNLAEEINLNAEFVCCDLYELPNHLNKTYDIVFSSYGTIGWLPDLDKWANIVSKYLKPGGTFVFVEFHPVVWMFDDDFNTIAYNYDNKETISGQETGTYADTSSTAQHNYVCWNHGLAEVLQALINHRLELKQFKEFDYSPYKCFNHTEEYSPGKYRIKHLENKIPMVYALKAIKTKNGHLGHSH